MNKIVKRGLMSLLAFLVAIVFVPEISASSNTTTLSDEVVNSLTIEDFVLAHEISTADEAYENLTEYEKDEYIIKIYNEIFENKKKQTISPYSLADSYNALNSAEKKLVTLYPAQAALVYTASSLANKRAAALYVNGLHNGNGDAFRHTYWNAELATMLAGYGVSFSPSDGIAKAKRWADAHETTSGQPALEKSMDLFNNNVGRSLVNKKYSSKDLENMALSKVNNGSCRRISGSSLVKTTSAK